MGGRRKWAKWIQFMLILVVLGEISFLFSLDRLAAFNFRSFRSWNEFKFKAGQKSDDQVTIRTTSFTPANANCEQWLEEADRIHVGRNFTVDPIIVGLGETNVWEDCAVGCEFRSAADNVDGIFRQASGMSLHTEKGTSHIHRSMEPTSYYPDNVVESAHGKGFDVVMTTSLASDVPVGYFSWSEYDIMAPVERKTEDSMAAAFISNCAAHNFRLEALQALRKHKVSIDSYGACLRTHEGGQGVNKLETLKRYKFSFAFENSNEDDYVTEKFWQSLVAGTVPVVVGAPNILQFAPAPDSVLHLKSLDSVEKVAREIRYLASNETAYNETLRWKFEGPTDAFKALVDMAAVHSSCRLCIHLATQIRLGEEKEHADLIAKRPCQCADNLGIVTYHLNVRERGRFQLESVFVRSTDLTISGLQAAVLAKFKSLRHIPIWFQERPSKIKGDGSLNIHTLYPVGLSQRQALYSTYFHNDMDVKAYIEENLCPKLEVIFV